MNPGVDAVRVNDDATQDLDTILDGTDNTLADTDVFKVDIIVRPRDAAIIQYDVWHRTPKNGANTRTVRAIETRVDHLYRLVAQPR